jgi:hypothetical protein
MYNMKTAKNKLMPKPPRLAENTKVSVTRRSESGMPLCSGRAKKE